MASFYSSTITSLVRRWEVKVGMGVQEWEYDPKKGLSFQMKRQYPIGVDGVLSEIGLMTINEPVSKKALRVPERVLVKGLQYRFRATKEEAQEAIRLAILFGSIRRAPGGWIVTREKKWKELKYQR
jgi:hypothetical protein